MIGRFLSAIVLLAGTASAQLSDTVFAEYQAETEIAAERGLAFIAAQQLEAGNFEGWRGRSSGIVSLAGMAFLSKGHLPGRGPYGDNVNRCIDYVISRARENGLLTQARGIETMYAHNIATLFLSEVSGMVDPARQEKLSPVLAAATQLILDAQAVPKSERMRGGWRYQPDTEKSDVSCSGWALMALKSARLNGARVPDDAIAAAVDYLWRHYDEENGGFGYTTAQAKETLAGCGLLCIELTGGHGDPRTLRTGDYILSTLDTLGAARHELYGNYYNAQGMFQLGGKYWARYAAWMYPHYLPKQKKDGSWGGSMFGGIYSTSMVVLAMNVPYRQLPIYQRDETVSE